MYDASNFPIEKYRDFIIKCAPKIYKVNIYDPKNDNVSKFRSSKFLFLIPWVQFVVEIKELGNGRYVVMNMTLVLDGIDIQQEFTFYISRKKSPIELLETYQNKLQDTAKEMLDAHPEFYPIAHKDWTDNKKSSAHKITITKE